MTPVKSPAKANLHKFSDTPQVPIIEFWAVATRPTSVNGLGWSPTAARDKIDELLTRIQVLPEPPDVFGTWLDTVTTLGVSGKRAHDARIVATLLASDVHHILTLNDADFSSFPELGPINPLSARPA